MLNAVRNEIADLVLLLLCLNKTIKFRIFPKIPKINTGGLQYFNKTIWSTSLKSWFEKEDVELEILFSTISRIEKFLYSILNISIFKECCRIFGANSQFGKVVEYYKILV